MKRMLFPGWGVKISYCVKRPSIHKFCIVVRCPSRYMLGQYVALEKVVSFHGFTSYYS
jgi:hypothetical protein